MRWGGGAYADFAGRPLRSTADQARSMSSLLFTPGNTAIIEPGGGIDQRPTNISPNSALARGQQCSFQFNRSCVVNL